VDANNKLKVEFLDWLQLQKSLRYNRRFMMALRIGNNNNNTLIGTGGSDLVFGLGGNDIINAGAGNDWVFAGSGNDIVFGGDGNDILFGDSGNDILNGGRGSDYVDGGTGNDTLIFNVADAGGFDIYNGGSGVDRIVFEMTAAQWANAAIKADVLAFLAHIAGGNTSSFLIQSLNLAVNNVENFQIKVDGLIIDPFANGNTLPTASNDVFSLSENGTLGAGSSVIGNDNTGTGAFTVTLASGPALGILALNANGTFTYDPGTAYDYLAAGTSATMAFTYQVTNSAGVSNIATVNITVTGTNDAPTVSGVFSGAVTEDDGEVTSASGSIIVNDADANQSGVVASVQEGTYGTLTLQVDGNWTYELDNSRAATQALNGGTIVTESFGVTSIDGTVLDAIQITVTGTNDDATVEYFVDGLETGDATVFEGGEANASGLAIVSDVDTGEAGIANPGEYVGVYGVLNIDENGAWTYALSQESAATQALNGDLQVTETFNLVSLDGTELSPLVINVVGENDAPTITDPTGNFAGFITFSGSVQSLNGNVDVVDLDADESAVVSDIIVGNWGTFSIESDGVWTYVRNDTPYDPLVDGEVIDGYVLPIQLLDTFTSYTVDGSAFNIDIATIEDIYIIS
jgi:large repetitive protein